ncbi:hypothetical protein ACL7TT_09710 [Microbulbifer sp. 2304DJ12-6]|uniref:hypothetical protein n=1 Tax=Microbulbifer sp. 2304DJ12-6 TaxID=3233340 RepID=UPI0039AEA19F
MKKIIFLVFVAFFHSQTLAVGIADSFDIDYVRIDHNGKGFIRFKRDIIHEPPTCAGVDYKNAMSFDTNKDPGRAIYSMALTAQASGKKVYAVGRGLCETYSQIESWNYGYIVDP